MELISKFIDAYGLTILYAVITAIAGYIGVTLKALYKKYINDKTKRDVCRTVVKAVEQLYRDIGGKAKFAKAKQSISDMLAEKGITITELEMTMLIEAAVAEFNIGFTTTLTETIEVTDEDM